MRSMGQGRVVLLNGPSSAGKTTVAHALADLLPTPWLVMPADLFHAIRSRPRAQFSEEQWQSVFRKTRAAYHRAVVGAAEAGCDVIADHVLSEPWRLSELLELTVTCDVLLVHVTCDAEELDRREVRRGDRDSGTARRQLNAVFAHGDCDLIVDTTRMASSDAAAAIVALLESPPRPTAFERLRLK